MNEPWQITLFGALSARQGEHVITRFRYQKGAGLLAYLAYHLPQAHPREVLLDLFWPENGPEAGRISLSTVLSSLRHQFEPPGIPAHSVIRADRFSVGLNPAAVTTDVLQFEAALKGAAQAESPTARRQHLTRAVDLYQGRLLPGFYEEWIPGEQERLGGLFFEAVSQLIPHLEAIGDLSAALQYACKAVSVDPLREEAHQHLMRLLSASGQPGAALRQYKELERLLEEELGVEPSASLRALARQIEEESGLSALALRPPAVRPRQIAVPTPVAVPSGMPVTVNFLLTDIEGSTRLWEQAGDAFQEALARHHQLMREAFSRHGGQELKEAGDSFLVAFASAKGALACAIACQEALTRQEWPEALAGAPLRVRMALHTGDVVLQEGEYHGVALHRASRMLTAGHGGQILVSEATAGLLGRNLEERVRLKDLGVYRLRDVATPERLFQVAYPGMAIQEFGPLIAEAGYAVSLPLQVTRFFGREAEIRHLERLLTVEAQRLVTLTGPGGTGKTRLAIEAARHLAQVFEGAIWFVALSDLREPGLIPDMLLSSLKLPRVPDREPIEQMVAALSRQPTLLVLDGAEHLVAGVAGVVRTLLERVPPLTCLVTSRQLLGLAGETPFAVPPLPTPHGPEAPETLSLYDSVRLFVDRAQGIKPDFQVTSINAPAVAELCLRLEGIPLAIELAASRAGVLTPLQMLSRLEDRFRFLVSRRRDIEARHRTLQAAMEWSFQLLTPEVQRFFRRLSVFRGGWTVEAAESVCEEPLALDYLAQLQECSLVLVEEAQEVMRFRMLDSLREYGADRLQEASEEAAVRKRHAEFFVTLAEAAEPKLTGSEQVFWLNCLEAELDNFRAALEWSPGDSEVGLRLAGALEWFWRRKGYYTEGRTWLGKMLVRSTKMATKWRAKGLHVAGVLARNQGDFASAHSLFEESLAIFQELGNRWGIATALLDLGGIARNQGNYVSAYTLVEESLAIFRELNNKPGIAASLDNLGLIDYRQGKIERARSLYGESLTIKRELGDKDGIALSLNNLGGIARDQANFELALSLYEESMALWRESGDRGGVAMTFSSLGVMARVQGDYTTARLLFEESLAVFREIGDRAGVATALENLGLTVCDQKDYGWARLLYEESLAIRQQLGERLGIALSLSSLGGIAQYQGDLVLASSRYQESLTIFRELGHQWCIASVLNNLGKVACEQKDFQRARSLYQESLAIYRELGGRQGIADVLKGFAVLEIAWGQPECAIRLYGAAAALREAIGTPLPPSEQPEYDQYLTILHNAFDETAFTSLWEAGRKMSWEEAVAFALGEKRSPLILA